jgi:hypothetical protein
MKRTIFASVVLSAIAFIFPPVAPAASLLTTTTPGYLIFEAIEGHGDTSNQEFGLGTPPIGAPANQRQIIFTIHLRDEQIDYVTPSNIVNMGFFPAGSALDFYNISDYRGEHWAFSSTLDSSPSASDLEVFRDRNNSLGFEGSVVEVVGLDHWILHLDDAGSIDDDDNEMILRVRVEPVPEPSGTTLFVVGFAFLAFFRRLAIRLPEKLLEDESILLRTRRKKLLL